MDLLKILKALADENRLRVLNLLAKKELCVCEMEKVLGITQSNTSRHLIKLSEAGIIDSEKQGQFVFYKINYTVLNKYPFLQILLEQETSKINKFQADLEALGKLENSGELCKRESCFQKE